MKKELKEGMDKVINLEKRIKWADMKEKKKTMKLKEIEGTINWKWMNAIDTMNTNIIITI